MEHFFEVDPFLSRFKPLLENNTLETKHIAGWLNCTVRHVQKWAINSGVDFISKGGRKYYVWNEAKIREFATYYNRNYNKPKEPPKPRKKYYAAKWDKPIELIKPKLNLEIAAANLHSEIVPYLRILYFYYRSTDSVLRMIFNYIHKVSGKKLADEYFIQKIKNEDPELLDFIQYFLDNPKLWGSMHVVREDECFLEKLSKIFDSLDMQYDPQSFYKHEYHKTLKDILPRLNLNGLDLDEAINIIRYVTKRITFFSNPWLRGNTSRRGRIIKKIQAELDELKTFRISSPRTSSPWKKSSYRLQKALDVIKRTLDTTGLDDAKVDKLIKMVFSDTKLMAGVIESISMRNDYFIERFNEPEQLALLQNIVNEYARPNKLESL